MPDFLGAGNSLPRGNVADLDLPGRSLDTCSELQARLFLKSPRINLCLIVQLRRMVEKPALQSLRHSAANGSFEPKVFDAAGGMNGYSGNALALYRYGLSQVCKSLCAG